MPSSDAGILLESLQIDSSVYHVDCLGIMSVDSTNMTPDRMARIATAIYDHYSLYDGFVVTHGTDTMAYSASMVAYMLRNLTKPIVFTGSQIPMEEKETDAIENLNTAFEYVMSGQPGVYIAFYGKIMPALLTKKMYSKNYDAFHAVKNRNLTVAASDLPLILKKDFSAKVMLLKVFPGMSSDLLYQIKNLGYRGLVLEGYGVGNVPDCQDSITKAIINLRESGIAIAITTQCVYDGTEPGIYEVSSILTQYDMIDGADMTTEALVMKMMWALGNCQNLQEIRQCIETPYCGDRSAGVER